MGPAEAFALLEIPATAAEDGIRRAYARKLRSFRPDEDPEGFQRLVQARDIAVAQLRFRAWATAAPPSPEPSGGGSSGPGPASPPPPAGDEVAEREATSGRASAVAEQPREPPAREPGSPAQELQDPLVPELEAPPAPENAPPSFAHESGAGEPYPAEAPDTGPQANRDAAASNRADSDRVATPADVLDALRTGLKRLVKEKMPFDVRGLEALLLELPAGAGRFIESEAILEIWNSLPILEASPPYPLLAERSLERLAVMLTDHFGWRDNDRALFAVLSASDAERFEKFLADAHEVHAPGGKTRFARAAKVRKAPEKQRGSGFSYGWLVIAFVVMSALGRIGGNYQPATRTPAYNPMQEFLQQTEHMAQNLRDMEAKLAFEVDRDHETLLADYNARLAAGDKFPLHFIHIAADAYQSRGMHAEAFSLLDRLTASENLRYPHRGDLKRYRGDVWLRAYGWSDAVNCKRRPPSRPVTLTAEGEAKVREELQDAISRTSMEIALGAAVKARLLELSDHLAGQKRFGELSAVLDELKALASQLLLNANLEVEIATIRRCMLPAGGRG